MDDEFNSRLRNIILGDLVAHHGKPLSSEIINCVAASISESVASLITPLLQNGIHIAPEINLPVGDNA